MKTMLTAALVLAALTSAALADGAIELTDAQMDKVTAGAWKGKAFGVSVLWRGGASVSGGGGGSVSAKGNAYGAQANGKVSYFTP